MPIATSGHTAGDFESLLHQLGAIMIIRQGDVLLVEIDKLPNNLTLIPPVNGRIVLAYGEVTGHAHVIVPSDERAIEIAGAVIARARHLSSDKGDRYLEVVLPVSLRHEEHDHHEVPSRLYYLPVQCEYNSAVVRPVTD